MDDKFILMGLDDERSKQVAEILGNKTCKKILDYLAETKEASEKDISDSLSMPLNTTEYNLKKLLDSGLVERTKNFFWSSKGRKIPMYKIAKKHIIISHKSSKPNLSELKILLPILLSIAFIALIAILFTFQENKKENLQTFDSFNELNSFIKRNTISGDFGNILYESTTIGTVKSADTSLSSAGASDYSKTNIQVEGVDEPDIIKNDGKYIYVVSNKKIIILDAFPAENMKTISEINFSDSVKGIFINKDKLIVFSQEYRNLYKTQESGVNPDIKIRCFGGRCPGYSEQLTKVYVYDISNRESPKLEENISVTGNYVNSRMINDYVYVISNQYIYGDNVVLPMMEKNGVEKIMQPTDIYYPGDIKDNSFQYTTILALNINNKNTNQKTILTGGSYNVFVSQNNIYTTYYKNPIWYDKIRIMNQEGYSEENGRTVIDKISINKEEINYIGKAEVPGSILNQFSMDEYNENFRIATTISGYIDNKDTSTNNLYVLDKDLKIIGKIEGIATGESIYAVRFLGNRAYMITFKHVDPLFVIGLEDPTNPTLLGKLKIPGYSEYLHPYDENHIIGIGKEVDESIDADKVHTEGAIYYTAIQGVKIAIFDVSDVSNPVEMYKEVIGDRGTTSPAETEHKAFLFDKEKELLVIPITLAELKENQQKSEQGDFTFQGAYVYNINLEDGFELRGRITHYEDDEAFKKSGYYFFGNREVQRTLYMDDTLYSFSQEIIKANDLNDLREINKVELPVEENNSPIYYMK